MVVTPAGDWLDAALVDEVQHAIAKSTFDWNKIDLRCLFGLLGEASRQKARHLHYELGAIGLPVQEIEGTLTEPGAGHVLLAASLLLAA